MELMSLSLTGTKAGCLLGEVDLIFCVLIKVARVEIALYLAACQGFVL